jgi:hypothetical protein
MNSQVMTLIGAIAASLQFIQAGIPADSPLWVRLCIGSVGAGLSYYLGQTNKGTSQLPLPEQRVNVTVTEKK